jgi:predicted amidohydrolase
VAADTTLVVGFLERDAGLLYDSAATVTPDGRVSVYRKTHLYPAELGSFAAGQTLGAVASPAGMLGPLLCFEHAFPDIATTLALAGAEILVIPSAVPFGFEHLLELRTRARGQDNQVFAVGCNMVGHGFCGRSLVTDPRGEVIASAGEDETVLRARLDLGAIAAERSREPALGLRRPELYSARSDST